ncbi:MAG: hypothetical protein GXO17_00990 [Thermodesulfobacteria bacterium]|nr:hypothetical protein [Thermodesulfobacteriota bacterium]
MRVLIYHLLLLLVFLFYQFLAAVFSPPLFDPFFPLLLGGLFWRFPSWHLFLAVFFWGLVNDTFSFLVPGSSVIAYAFGLFLFWQLKRKLALRGFFPALVSLLISISVCELLRLWIIPVLLELPLPVPGFYFIGRLLLGTLTWGFLCWVFCQFSLVRNFLEISSTV